jgi:hypothetical protein
VCEKYTTDRTKLKSRSLAAAMSTLIYTTLLAFFERRHEF